jgi:hypothetical protein
MGRRPSGRHPGFSVCPLRHRGSRSIFDRLMRWHLSYKICIRDSFWQKEHHHRCQTSSEAKVADRDTNMTQVLPIGGRRFRDAFAADCRAPLSSDRHSSTTHHRRRFGSCSYRSRTVDRGRAALAPASIAGTTGTLRTGSRRVSSKRSSSRDHRDACARRASSRLSANRMTTRL